MIGLKFVQLLFGSAMSADDLTGEMPIQDVLYALDQLPIVHRLEVAAMLILAHGGDKGSTPNSPPLVLAGQIVFDVIDVLKAHPKAAKLWKPEP
jgi:hypothetical protein